MVAALKRNAGETPDDYAARFGLDTESFLLMEKDGHVWVRCPDANQLPNELQVLGIVFEAMKGLPGDTQKRIAEYVTKVANSI